MKVFRMKRNVYVFLLVVTLGSFIAIIYYYCLSSSEHHVSSSKKSWFSNLFFTHRNRVKKILFWNDFYGREDYWWGFDREPFLTHCPDGPAQNCMTTKDKSQLSSSDAVIIHARAVNIRKHWPQKRYPGQRWTMFLVEPPPYALEDFTGFVPHKLKQFNSIFNDTFTYRMDSDAIRLYGQYVENFSTESQHILVNNTKNYAAGRTRLISWFVSNCKTSSKREEYVKELQKHVTVDIYGKCGILKCPRFDSQCDNVIQTYKFYLSFENSYCLDYVTEKFFYLLKLDVVPVVFGGANYSFVAPPHSYINSADFNSPKELAHYLLVLDKNDEKYNEYFAWKGKWKMKYPGGFCTYCANLNDPSRSGQVHHDVYKWFITDAKCKYFNKTTKKLDFITQLM